MISMQNTMNALCYSLALCFLVSVTGCASRRVEIHDSETLAKRFGTCTNQADVGEVMKTVKELPEKQYPQLLAALCATGQYSYEAASFYVGSVASALQNRVGDQKMAHILLKIFEDKQAPMELKKHLAQMLDKLTYGYPPPNLVNLFRNLDYDADKDAWLIAQYGLSRILRLRYSEAQRVPLDPVMSAAIEKTVMVEIEENVERLISHGVRDDLLETWTLKTLCNYRGILPDELDFKLVGVLSESRLPVPKQLLILRLVYCWGKNPEVVADYAAILKKRVEEEKVALTAEDSKAIETLLGKGGTTEP